jgi:succinylarginine dihydrolase
MRVLDNLITRWAERIQQKQINRWNNDEEVAAPTPRRGHARPLGASSNRRVEHNYDDESVITFKVYGANGGKIVETARYDDKKDNESIRRYVISEDDDLAESLGKIVTMEYLR